MELILVYNSFANNLTEISVVLSGTAAATRPLPDEKVTQKFDVNPRQGGSPHTAVQSLWNVDPPTCIKQTVNSLFLAHQEMWVTTHCREMNAEAMLRLL
jgi:hypothetical protein